MKRMCLILIVLHVIATLMLAYLLYLTYSVSQQDVQVVNVFLSDEVHVDHSGAANKSINNVTKTMGSPLKIVEFDVRGSVLSSIGYPFMWLRLGYLTKRKQGLMYERFSFSEGALVHYSSFPKDRTLGPPKVQASGEIQ